MPNVKIYVDEAIYPPCRDRLPAALGPILDMLSHDLTVDRTACQNAVMPVMAMPGLPPVNVEMQIMPSPERARMVLLAVCAKLRETVSAFTGANIAIRVTTLDPETWIAMK